jgi:sodium-dependent dicarboxylate transporter 2/3/5
MLQRRTVVEARPPESLDRLRARIGGVVVLPAMAAAFVLPVEVPAEQRSLLAVLAFVVVLWITEPIPIPATALIGIALLVLLGVAEAPVVYGAFGSPTLFLVIGAFTLARAMSLHGLDRRFALRVLSLPGIGDSTYRTVLAFGLIATLLAMLVSSSATAAMLLPIGLGVVRAIGERIDGDRGSAPSDIHRGGDPMSAHPSSPSHQRFGCLLMLAIAYGAAVGCILTPVTGIANIVGRGAIEEMTGRQIGLFEWMALSGPYLVALGATMFSVLLLMNRPSVKRIPGGQQFFSDEYRILGPISRGEKNVLCVFAVTIALWILPSLVATIGIQAPWLLSITGRLNEGSVVIACVGILFALPGEDGNPTLDWRAASAIDWGTVILVGVGLTIGRMMGDTGLAATVGDALAGATGVSQLWTLCVVAVLLGMLVSELTINTASVGIVVPVIIPLAVSIGVDPLIPAMAAIFGASAGAMLPVSTPPNAIVYGSGLVPITRMIRTGLVNDILTAPLAVAAALGLGTLTGLYI